MNTLSKDAQEYATLIATRRNLEADVAALVETLTKMEADLLQRMGDEGCASLKVKTTEGTFTLFSRRELWSSCIPGHEQELNDGLRSLGMGDLVQEKVNSQRLSSYIRELDVVGTAVPVEIVNAVKVTERFRVGVRKAT